MIDESAEEIEMGVMGAILLSSQGESDSYTAQLVQACRAKGVRAEWFTAGDRRRLWEAICGEADSRGSVDPMLVSERFGEGGAKIVGDAIEATPTTAHFEYYLDALVERRVYVEYHRWLREQLEGLKPRLAKIRVEDAAKRISELQTLAKGGGESLHGVDEYVDELVAEKRWLSEERFVKRNWGKYRGVPMPWGQTNIIYKGLKTGLHIWAFRVSFALWGA